MRKKSHISLSKYLIENMKVYSLEHHRLSFYIGSLLPDMTPSFLTKRHTIDQTFEILVKEIKKITVDYDMSKGISSFYVRHLGIITHYLADYCTYPHNTIYPGTLKDHVHYENELKLSLREYVTLETAKRKRAKVTEFHTLEEMTQFIQSTHNEYLNAKKIVLSDIEYIIELSYKIVDAIIGFFETIVFTPLSMDYRNSYQVDYSQA